MTGTAWLVHGEEWFKREGESTWDSQSESVQAGSASSLCNGAVHIVHVGRTQSHADPSSGKYIMVAAYSKTYTWKHSRVTLSVLESSFMSAYDFLLMWYLTWWTFLKTIVHVKRKVFSEFATSLLEGYPNSKCLKCYISLSLCLSLNNTIFWPAAKHSPDCHIEEAGPRWNGNGILHCRFRYAWVLAVINHCLPSATIHRDPSESPSITHGSCFLFTHRCLCRRSGCWSCLQLLAWHGREVDPGWSLLAVTKVEERLRKCNHDTVQPQAPGEPYT